jgi:hypothetical protein
LTRRWRSPRYGAAIGLTLIGVACGATIPGTLGGTLATALIGLGLVGIVSLVFYEIGLSEDRDRAHSVRPPDQASPDQAPPDQASPDQAPPPPGHPDSRLRPAPRPDRMRGQRRRLR